MLIVVAYGMDVEGVLAVGGQGHGRRTSGVGLGELLAQLQDGRYEVLSGIEPGEQLIISAPSRLKNGTAVKLAK